MGRIWTKLLIALRGGVDGTCSTKVARQGLRILELELRAADEQLHVGRSNLANLMTKKILAGLEVRQTQEQLSTLMARTSEALAGQNDDVALELAAQIGRLELILVEDSRIAQEYAHGVDNLRQALELTESKLRLLKRQIEQVRTTDLTPHMQSGFQTARREPVAALQILADTLESICDQQEQLAEQLRSDEVRCIRDPELERRLRDISTLFVNYSAGAVLARIRASVELAG